MQHSFKGVGAVSLYKKGDPKFDRLTVDQVRETFLDLRVLESTYTTARQRDSGPSGCIDQDPRGPPAPPSMSCRRRGRGRHA